MGSRADLGVYQTLGNLYLRFADHAEPASEYVRDLDLARGVATVAYRIGERAYRRTYFASAVHQVLVVRIEPEQPGDVSFYANFMRRPLDPGSRALPGDRIMMKGRVDAEGVLYCAAAQAILDGSGSIETVGDCISVKGADAVTLLVAAATSYRHSDPQVVCEERLEQAAQAKYDDLLHAHESEHRRLYSRVEIDLGGGDRSAIPTDERLKHVAGGGDDPGLIELLFNYGRYLLIAASRPGSMAANLQGVWNESFTPPWESVYTININIQMNYWPAEVCGLSECHEPLFDLVDAMRPQGRRTARSMYGCRGFVAHHNTSIWGNTAPTGAGVYIWPLGAAWLALHFWEHYLFNLDRDFLEARADPTLREAALFFVDFLVEDEDGTLITGLSQSPENRYRLPNGQTSMTAKAPAMDAQILDELFGAVIEASEILEIDEEFRVEIEACRAQLQEPKIGSLGQLLEWSEEYEEVEPGHRHWSHLFALHPGNRISPERTPELAEAARTSIERRLAHGGGGTGWSLAWLVNFWARLADGDRAHEAMLRLLSKSLFPNLLNGTPYQIDANFGATAGLAEMLLQSHNGEINVLPALPGAWKNGSARGLRARGGYTVDLLWRRGALVEAVVSASRSGRLRVRLPLAGHGVGSVDVVSDGEPVPFLRVDERVVEFEVRSGSSYAITLERL